MPPAESSAHLEVNTLSIKTLVDVPQAALDDADRLFKLHARAQRACCEEAGQRAHRLPVQPGALLAVAQPLQVGLQLCNEPVLAILTCQQNMCKPLQKDEHNLRPNLSRKTPDPLCGLLVSLCNLLRVACADSHYHEH